MCVSHSFFLTWLILGGDASSLEGLDGTDQWDFLLDVTQADPKNEFLVNINEDLNDWAVVKNEWKFIHGKYFCSLIFSRRLYLTVMQSLDSQIFQVLIQSQYCTFIFYDLSFYMIYHLMNNQQWTRAPHGMGRSRTW